MHPDIRLELARQKQAEFIAATEASRAAARAGDDACAAPRWLAHFMQRTIVRPWSRRRPLPAGASDRSGAHVGGEESRPYHLELEGPILIRRSGVIDQAALQQLAALDSRKLPEGSFLLAEIHGELVAAAPLDVDAEPMADPFRPTANVRELLRLRADHVRRHREALPPRARTAAPRALPDTA